MLKASIKGWDTDKALKYTENLVQTQGYGPGKTKLDAVLSPADCLSSGILTSLKNAGYTPQNIPVVTGQDCEKTAVQAILDGTQAMSVYKDGYELADRAVIMVNQIIDGKTVEVNDTESYDNGVKVVPTFQADVTYVEKDTIKSKLFDSGFLKASDFH